MIRPYTGNSKEAEMGACGYRLELGYSLPNAFIFREIAIGSCHANVLGKKRRRKAKLRAGDSSLSAAGSGLKLS
jgi:hypothetical protein